MYATTRRAYMPASDFLDTVDPVDDVLTAIGALSLKEKRICERK